MTAPNSAYTLSSFGSAPFGEQPAPWENNENGSSEQFLNLTRNPHVQNDELNRFNYPNQNISSNISSSSSNNMNLNLNSDFMQHNEQKSSEIEGGVDFISHFPGPPIQTNKTCQQGPDGCNLFIFHIPNDLTNMDLYNLFTPFGAVISARIMVENETGRSRGFGFVSFDHPSGAHAAIRSMNGFQIGHKRLKVAHKKEIRDGGFDDLMLSPSMNPHMMPGRGGYPQMMNGRQGYPRNMQQQHHHHYQNNHIRYNNGGHMPMNQHQPQHQSQYMNRYQNNMSDQGNLDSAMSNMHIGTNGGYGRAPHHQQGVGMNQPQSGFVPPYGQQPQQFNSTGGNMYVQSPPQNAQPSAQMETWLQQQQQQQQQQPQVDQASSKPAQLEHHESGGSGSSFSEGGSPDTLFLEAHKKNLKLKELEVDENVLGGSFDLLNNVRQELTPKSQSPKSSDDGGGGGKEDMWGSAPTPSSMNPQGKYSSSHPSSRSSSHSLSPPKTNVLGAIERSNSSLSNHSDSAKLSPSSSPSRAFSPSPVSVVTSSNKKPGSGGEGYVMNELDTSASSSMPIQGSPQASALTSALNAPQPPAVPASMLPPQFQQVQATPVSAPVDGSAPMSTEQILMLQEQLKQQQALIAGQNELLQTLLAQQQALAQPPTAGVNQHDSSSN